MAPDESARKEIQFEWSHFSILTTDSKFRSTFQDSIFPFGRERVKCRPGLYYKKTFMLFQNRSPLSIHAKRLCFKEE